MFDLYKKAKKLKPENEKQIKLLISSEATKFFSSINELIKQEAIKRTRKKQGR